MCDKGIESLDLIFSGRARAVGCRGDSKATRKMQERNEHTSNAVLAMPVRRINRSSSKKQGAIPVVECNAAGRKS